MKTHRLTCCDLVGEAGCNQGRNCPYRKAWEPPRAMEAMSWPEKVLIGVIAAVLLLFCAWVAWLVFANWHQIVAFMPY